MDTAAREKKNNFETFDKKIQKIIRNLEPIRSAAYFSALSMSPLAQNNLFRIETLVHYIFSNGMGKKRISDSEASLIFSKLGDGYYRAMEDPLEDIMIGVIHHPSGSYQLLNGLWESNTFYTQLFIDVLKDMPNSQPYKGLKESILAILKISDYILTKQGLERNRLGVDHHLRKIPNNHLNVSREIEKVFLSNGELNSLGVERNQIHNFLYPTNKEHRKELASQSELNNDLIYKPIVDYQDGILVLLPTAIGIAIRDKIILFSENLELISSLNHSIIGSYINLFSRGSRLIGINKDLNFSISQKDNEILGANCLIGKDDGTFIQFILVFDSIDSYKPERFIGFRKNYHSQNKYIAHLTNEASIKFSQLIDFKECLTLVIVCGWGRGYGFIPEQINLRENWKIEYTSAPEIATFSQLKDMSPYHFIKFLEARDKLLSTNLRVHNLGGLLNLYASALRNDFHILKHEDLPEELNPWINPNCLITLDHSILRSVREVACSRYDRHMVLNFDGNKNILVEKFPTDYFFKERDPKKIYASLDHIYDGELVSLVYGKKIKIWSTPLYEDNSDRDLIYRLWDALNFWLDRLIHETQDILSAHAIDKIIWKWSIENYDINLDSEPSDLLSGIICKSKKINNEINILTIFKKPFLQAFNIADNTAERLIVSTFLHEALKTINYDANISEIINRVFRNNDAKMIHMFGANNILDLISQDLPQIIMTDPFDDPILRIGLAWRVRNPELGHAIYGVDECTRFINELVLNLWKDLELLLRQFNKNELILKFLLNIEVADKNISEWNRTYKSALALYEDKNDVNNVVVNQLRKLSQVALTGRIAIEMAISTCQVNEGYIPNEMDMSKIMAYVALIFHTGNWSDCIKYGTLNPEIHFSPLGQIMMDYDGYDTIMNGYSTEIQSDILNSSINKYKNLFKKQEERPIDIESNLDHQFISAAKTEFGILPNDLVKAMIIIANRAVDNRLAIIQYNSVDEIINMLEKAGLDNISSSNFVSYFIMPIRENWLKFENPYNFNDVAPWRFKRRLSILFKPIIQTENKLFIAPNLLLKAISYVQSGCEDGLFDDRGFRSKEMRSWIGNQRNKIGHDFNTTVAEKFQKNGWNATSEVKLTEILKFGLEKDYGDVDVLAWDNVSKRVLLIECKKLEIAKTPSEVAKQIQEFNGRIRPDGKPDRLHKHLERARVLNENKSRVEKYLGLDNCSMEVVVLFGSTTPLFHTNTIQNLGVKVMRYEDITLPNF